MVKVDKTMATSQTMSDMESQGSSGVFTTQTVQGSEMDSLLKEKFSHDSFSDLNVYAGENRELIPCHRFVLAKHSEVLRTMLGPRWQGDTEPLTDLLLEADDPEAFRVMIRYMYTSELMPDISNHTLIHALDLAKKYDVPRLTSKVVERLITCISVHNALSVYFASVLYEVESTKARAFAIITMEAQAVIQTEEFLALTDEELRKFVCFDELHVSEVTLLQAVHKWAETACANNDLEVTPENCRLCVKDILQFIRYNQMTPEQFVVIAEETELFEPWEKYEIMYELSNFPPRKKRPRLSFDYNKNPRHGGVKTFRSRGLFYFGVKHQDRYENGLATISFKVDRPIALHTVGIHLPKKSELPFGKRPSGRSLMSVTIQPEDLPPDATSATSVEKRSSSQFVKLEWNKESYYRFRFEGNMEIIAPDKYYEISFAANGFEPRIYKEVSKIEKEVYKVVCGEETNVIFTLKTPVSTKMCASSSKEPTPAEVRFQLPQIHFALGKPLKMEV